MFGVRNRADRLRARVFDALSRVQGPQDGVSLTRAGIVSGLQVSKDGQVVFALEVDPALGATLEPMRQEAERAALSVRGVKKVSAVLTAARAVAPQKPVNEDASVRVKNDPHGIEKNPRLKVPSKNIIAVASGKGGVGKSTVAYNIAQYLANFSQLKVGLLDADIYGPSQPNLMGLEGYKPEFTEDKKIIPAHVQAGTYGLKMMSIGFMVEAEKALIWRGPMVQSALYQLFRDAQWGDLDAAGEEAPLDVLIVDMPPGTGDAQLTLAQKVPVTGAVIVSTPQDLALIDARKAIEMFQKTDVPVLGMIENMSTHICSNCGHEEHIFDHGGARQQAEALGVDFLGEVPLDIKIRQNGADNVENERVFAEISEKILKKIKI